MACRAPRIAPDGQFDLAGISGPRRLQVGRAPAGWMVKAILAGGIDVTDQVMSFGRDDESRDDIEVVLANRTTQVIGSLSDLKGRSPTDLAVLAFATDQSQWYAAPACDAGSAPRPTAVSR